MEHGIELLGQPCVEVVARALRPGAVDHADSPLQPWPAQALYRRTIIPQRQQEAWQPDVVEQLLVAALQRRAHLFALGRSSPVRGSRDRAPVRAETDQDGREAMVL